MPVPVTPAKNAVMFVCPGAIPVTTPVEETVATLWSELDQVAWEVISVTEGLEDIAVAVNC
jgi:hypothetical protein